MAERKEEYFQARDIYLVNISIIRAINLPKADTFGKSDGFVKVVCLNRKFRTITVKKDLNPKWDAKTQMQFFHKPMQIKFRVLDWNASGIDTPLGNYVLDIRDDWWVRDSPGLPKTIVKMKECKRGEIEIAVTCSKLEPFGYLDKMRQCAELKIQYKNDLDKCAQNIKNCNGEYQQNQQACAAYEQKCNQLQDECTNKNEEKNTYEEQGRKYDSAINDLNSEVSTCDNKYNNLLKEYKDKDYDCDKIIKEYATVKKQCEQLINTKQQLDIQYKQKMDELQQAQQAYQQEQQQQQQHNTYDTKEPINEYSNDNNDLDDEKRELYSKIRENEINIGKYDDELCNNIIEKYKEQYDIYNSGLVDDGSGSDDENNELESARIEGNKYLSKIKQWAQGCNEQAYSTMLTSLGADGDLNYNNSLQKQFVIEFCKQLNKFFFCLQIIDSTLFHFQDEILKQTNKTKISKVTFNDLAGTTDSGSDTKDDSYDEEDDEPTTLWNTLYEDLNFVIDELGDLFTPYIKTRPLQTMCKLQSEFIISCYNGNYYQFTKLIGHYILQYITDDDNNILNDNDDPNALLDDAITNTILILNDKKQFLYKLYKSITNAPKLNDNDEDNEYDEQDDTYDDGKFEMISAAIIVLVGQLDSSIINHTTKPNKEEQEKINEKSKDALDKCEDYGIDDGKSLELIKKFFSYFFVPEGGGGPCDCSGDDGGFFGKLFGSICK